MFMVILIFILAVVLPFAFRIIALPHDTASQIVTIVGVAALAIVAVSVAWRMFAPRTRRAEVRKPDPRRVSGLRWPSDLTQAELEGYCTAYLRGQGWQVTPVRTAELVDTFLEAVLQGAHILLQCDVTGTAFTPATMRSVAFAATSFAGARPAVLTLTRDEFQPSLRSAAQAAGVLLLHVADLPRLADLAGACLQPPMVASSEAAEPVVAASARN